MLLSPHRAAIAAHGWYAAWNSHAVERIVSLCEPDVEYTSPMVGVVGLGADERIVGLEQVRRYVELTLERFPGLSLRPRLLFVGGEGLTLHYRILGGLLVSETLDLSGTGRIRRVRAYYASVLESELLMPTAAVAAGLTGTVRPDHVALHRAVRSGERRPGWARS